MKKKISFLSRLYSVMEKMPNFNAKMTCVDDGGLLQSLLSYSKLQKQIYSKASFARAHSLIHRMIVDL